MAPFGTLNPTTHVISIWHCKSDRPIWHLL
eukprot:COSAG02_NODE_20140_length_846_cov_43.469880_1_plen_29_part_10